MSEHLQSYVSDDEIAAEEAAEAAELARLEAVIAANLNDAKAAVGRAGEALREIHDRRLFPMGMTFEAYCQDVWQIGRARAYQLMDGARVHQVLSTRVDILPSTKALRELAPLKDKPEKLIEAWHQALELSEEPTAREVREIVQPMLRKEPKPKVLQVEPEVPVEPREIPPVVLDQPPSLEEKLHAVTRAVRSAQVAGATTNELYAAYQAGFH